ncbi:hypothetical protein CPLU01_12027 [Colletotrichum plurivorum]|uniref:Uncharacterized protein n=1 Tax=Colletotrichum plurivorum TaxID=2175906 RepID=A0A8H6K122_9PEZI|nr:hypothetical protein CPLU01_12027 [Colletotrichum plurivorum]
MKFLTLVLATLTALAAAAPMSHTDDPWKSPGDCNCEKSWGTRSHLRDRSVNHGQVVPKDMGSGKTGNGKGPKDDPADSDKSKPDTPVSNPKDYKPETPTKGETPIWSGPKSEMPSEPDSVGVGKPVYDQWGAPVAPWP